MNASAKIETAPEIITHKTLFSALTAGLAEVEAAIKDARNPHLGNKYADLASVIVAIRPIARHGLWFRQLTKPDSDGARIETFYIHESGEMSAGEMFVPAGKRDPQGFGSALTYCRRYALQTAFGIAPEDDDGEAANASFKKDQEVRGNNQKAQPAKPSASQNEKSTQGLPDAEWAKLVHLIEATGSDIKALCNFYKVDSLRDMDVERYGHAIKALNAKIAKRREEDAKAKQAANGFGELIDDEIPF